ncbi:MAG: serine hydroxymethyltransferase, partial [Nitrosomonas sp.]|nr:serine hydroxymethyltransferase [Nitrosomonas sp.]
ICTPAVSTRGFRELESEQLANLVADVLDAPADTAVLARVAQDAKRLCTKFPVYGE